MSDDTSLSGELTIAEEYRSELSTTESYSGALISLTYTSTGIYWITRRE